MGEIGIINIIAIYMFCGIIFSAGFEYLMSRMNSASRHDTTNWHRIVWVTTWPYCIVRFIIGYIGKN